MKMPEIPDHSPYQHYANQELLWLPMDTEQLYKKHLISKKNLLLENGWLDKKFTYKFNSFGFRSDEFSEEDSIMFLGCSHTIGIGLPYESTWPYIVAKSLRLKCYNLAIGGGSNDAAFRLAYNYIPKLKPKIVILLVTYNSRLEMLGQGREILQFFGPGTSPIRNDSFYTRWLMNEGNLNANLMKNVLSIGSICQMNNSKFFAIDQIEMPTIDLARDLAHRGSKSNFEFSKIVLKDHIFGAGKEDRTPN